MIRVTVQDPQQTISFLTDADIAERLIAGCSANPNAVGELLLATEVFHRGIAAAVMGSLIIFDKALQHGDATQALQKTADATGQNSLVCGAFQVIDDQTATRAFDTDATPLLILDLQERVITASSPIQVRTSGEIMAHSGEEVTGRAITYVLPQTWTVRSP